MLSSADLDDFKTNGRDMELDEVDIISHKYRAEMSAAQDQGWQDFCPEKMPLRSKRANADRLAEKMAALIVQDSISQGSDLRRPTPPSPIPIPLRKRDEVDAASLTSGSCITFNDMDAYSQLSPIPSSPAWSSGSNTTTSRSPSSPLWLGRQEFSFFSNIINSKPPKDQIFKKSRQEDYRSTDSGLLEDNRSFMSSGKQDNRSSMIHLQHVNNRPLQRLDSSCYQEDRSFSPSLQERSLNSGFHEDSLSLHSRRRPEMRSSVNQLDNQSFRSSRNWDNRSTTSDFHGDNNALNATYEDDEPYSISHWDNRSVSSSVHEDYRSLAPSRHQDCRKVHVAECEPSFRKIEPHQRYESRALTGDVQSRKSNCMRSILCAFCRNNGEMENLYRSHSVRNAAGQVTCPILRAYTCPLCGLTGDYAHTIKYCPKNRSKETIDIKRLTRCGRSSSGKQRIWSHMMTHPASNLPTTSSPTSESQLNWMMQWRGDRN